jgi:hypothetical protein
MNKKLIIGILVIIILLHAKAFSQTQETLTVTTYYPSPRGVYKTLRLYPTDDYAPGGACSNKGEMYYDDSDNQVYTCDGTKWTGGATTKIATYSWRTGWEANNGGCAVKYMSSGARPEFVGCNNVVVLLTGWRLMYDNGDKHIEEAEVLYTNDAINPATGEVTWLINICLNENGDDEPFHWMTWYTIMAW